MAVEAGCRKGEIFLPLPRALPLLVSAAMAPPPIIPVKALDAIEFLKSKLALPTEAFTDIWAEQHAKAFVVAGANTDALVTDFHVAVTKAIEEGQSIGEFRKSFDDIVARHGWSYKGSRGWRSRVIYETNMRQAFMNAKWQRFWANRVMRPFLRYVGILDDRIRPLHRSWHNMVLPITDPWWDTHYPMNGWGCRCDVQSLNEAGVKRLGLTVQKETPYAPTVRREVRSATGRYFVDTPKGVDPGFGYNVGIASSGKPPGNPVPVQWKQLQGLSDQPVPPLSTLPVDRATRLAKLPDAIETRIGDIESIVADPAGGHIKFSEAMAAQLKDGFTVNLGNLKDVVGNPAEIWVGFEKDAATGAVRLRRRYVKLVRDDEGKLVALVMDSLAREAIGVKVLRLDEAMRGEDDDLLDALRTGYLIWQRAS